MWKTQKKYEETVTVINENDPSYSSGGVAVITDASGVSIKMVMLPDETIFKEPRKEGQYYYERLYAHVSLSEMQKADIIPGKTKIIWNGETYKVYKKIDYSSKQKFRIAEIEMRRKIDTD